MLLFECISLPICIYFPEYQIFQASEGFKKKLSFTALKNSLKMEKISVEFILCKIYIMNIFMNYKIWISA